MYQLMFHSPITPDKLDELGNNAYVWVTKRLLEAHERFGIDPIASARDAEDWHVSMAEGELVWATIMRQASEAYRVNTSR
jgi:hypothetical protein